MLRKGKEKSGCSLNMFHFDEDFRECESQEEILKMQKYFESIKTTSLINDSWMCAPSCSNKNYKVVEIVEEPITWKTDWISEVFVKLKSESGIEKKTKYYTYEKVIRPEDVKN